MRRLAVAATLALLAFALPAARAEIAQRGDLRVVFSGAVSPKRLPRRGSAPISVRLGGRISTTDGSEPSPLERIEIAINRNAHLDPSALPSCRLEQIQPASTAYARRVCAAARVGEGTFSASVAIPEQSPYPSQGTVTAFNGRQAGRPVILLHVFGTRPLPTSFTMPLAIGRSRGSFGTVLRGTLPLVDAHVGFVTAIGLRLDGTRHGYLSAGCPAPAGFSAAVFPLARANFTFAAGQVLSRTLIRSCGVQPG